MVIITKVNSIILDDFTWSFSRINSFAQCPYQFKLQYIDCNQSGENNFFSDYGSMIHSILEKYAKGELEVFELASNYQENYTKEITYPAPPNAYVDLGERYFQAGLDYLSTFDDFGDFEILDVEREFLFEIEGIKLRAIIDLVAKDNQGKLHIIDHKSSDPKSAKSAKAKEYWKQMYLYSIPVKEEYGEYPVGLHINAFRKQQWFSIDFNEEEVFKVKRWVLETIDKIREEEDWSPNIDKFFCKFLCNFRNSCKYMWGG